MGNIEAPIRIVETDYSHQYVEIPTQNWPLARRWDWIKAIITGGDIIYRPRALQHVDLRPKETIMLPLDKQNIDML